MNEKPLSCVVLHIPHNSLVIPADIRSTFLLFDAELESELLAMTDRYTAELFQLADTQCVIFPVSRLVLDPERFLDDTQEVMAERGMGVIYTRTSTGKALRHVPADAARQALVNRFYLPHHHALTFAVDSALEAHSKCLIFDCHSFPSRPLPCELNQMPQRPQICIGTDVFHTPAWLTELATQLFRAQGYSTLINEPYVGTLVPGKHFQSTPSVHSIMIEINRALYMDETTGQKLSTFANPVHDIHRVLQELSQQFTRNLRDE